MAEEEAQRGGLELVEARVVADRLEALLVARAVEAQQRARGRRAPASLEATSPPSPRPKRFFVGKKLNVAATPSAPARPPPSSAPKACAASSTTGTPSGSSSSGAGRPKRCTARIAFVRGVTRAATSAGSRFRVGGVDVAEDRRGAPTRRYGLGRRVERERGADHLVARPDPERVEDEDERVGAVRDADGIARRRGRRRPPPRTARTSGPRMNRPESSTRRGGPSTRR